MVVLYVEMFLLLLIMGCIEPNPGPQKKKAARKKLEQVSVKLFSVSKVKVC